MHLVNSFLSRFAGLQSPEVLVRDALRTALKDVLSLDIHKEDIVYQSNRAFVRGGSAVKQALLLHQEALLKMVNEQLPDTISVREIR